MLTFNGRAFQSANFKRALEDKIVEKAKQAMLDKLRGLLDPSTGQPPTITVTGHDLKSLSVKVEGSKELIAEVKRRLGR